MKTPVKQHELEIGCMGCGRLGKLYSNRPTGTQKIWCPTCARFTLHRVEVAMVKLHNATNYPHHD